MIKKYPAILPALVLAGILLVTYEGQVSGTPKCVHHINASII